MARESGQERRPGSRTRQHRGLGCRPGRLPYLGALKYHGVVVAIPSARAPPHSRSRVVFALSPICRAFPSCPCLPTCCTMLAAAARALSV